MPLAVVDLLQVVPHRLGGVGSLLFVEGLLGRFAPRGIIRLAAGDRAGREAGGDEQPPGDGVVAQALADQADDLPLGRGQAGPAGGGAFASAALIRTNG